MRTRVLGCIIVLLTIGCCVFDGTEAVRSWVCALASRPAEVSPNLNSRKIIIIMHTTAIAIAITITTSIAMAIAIAIATATAIAI